MGTASLRKIRTGITPRKHASVMRAGRKSGPQLRLESGNCINLPDVVVATVHHGTSCLVNPETGSDTSVQLSAGQAVMVRGISADESWWNVYQPQDTSANCWLPKESVNLNGDISTLPSSSHPCSLTALPIS